MLRAELWVVVTYSFGHQHFVATCSRERCDDLGGRDTGAEREQADQRLVFDLLRTRHREGSTPAPIPKEPPRFREQLRVGGITSVNLHLECSPFGVRARKPHDAALTRELRELAHVDTA